jgi:hypothetical protein
MTLGYRYETTGVWKGKYSSLAVIPGTLKKAFLDCKAECTA